MIRCDTCGRKASVYQPQFNRRLCRECFTEDVRERVKREVERWKMVEAGDTIMMALSGGKDSYTLLDILPSIAKPSRLFGLSIIEGIPGYNREEDVRALAAAARERGIELITIDVKRHIGLSVHEMVTMARERGSRTIACTFCGVTRRRIMSEAAEALGANKIATAHNLDDEVQTLIMNYLRGDLSGIARLHPLAVQGTVKRIKPLRKIYEWETATYAMIMGFPLQETECMYLRERGSLRARLRAELYAIERELPGALLRALELLDSLEFRAEEASLARCSSCGAPAAPGRRICKLCELLAEIGQRSPAWGAMRLRDRVEYRAHLEGSRGAQGLS